MMTDLIGIGAAILTTCALLPQILVTLKTRDATSLSLSTLICLSTGKICWLIYGVSIGSLPIIASNGFSASLTLILLVLKVRDVVIRKPARPPVNA